MRYSDLSRWPDITSVIWPQFNIPAVPLNLETLYIVFPYSIVLAGMGDCAMIGQSMINIRSGGRGRLAGIAASLFLL